MKKNNYPGKLIAVEGLDGSGQSTQAELLRKFLVKQGNKVLKTKEPTPDSEPGREIRKILNQKEKASAKQLQQLFAQDRKWHLKNIIIPALKQGKIVISDRYFFSCFAFGAASGLDLSWLIKINSQFLMPDLTIFLEVSPGACIERIAREREQRTIFEKKKKLKKAGEVYKTLTEKFENIKVINGERPVEEVAKEIKEVVHSKLNL